jgi:hypothetical protein
MAVITVGSVSVDVVPNASRFAQQLRATIVPQAGTLGEEIGKQIADRIAASIRNGLQNGLQGGNPGAQGGQAGRAYGDEFSRVVKTRIEAALRSLPEVQIGVATSAAEQKLRDLHVRLEELRDKRVGVDIDAKDALAEVEKIRIELDELARKSPDIAVRVDAARAVAELAAVKAEVDKLDGQHADVKVDSGAASAGVSGLVAGIATIGPALIPIGAAAVAGLGGVATLAVAGIAGLGVLKLGLSGISAAVKAVDAEQAAAGADAKAYGQAQEAAAAAVQGAQATLANAISSADNASISSAQAVQTARTGLGKAIESADNAAISSAQAVSNAQTGVADAVRAAGLSVTNALQAQDTAEQALTQAQQQAQSAQDALTSARKTAQQQIQDLTLSVQDGALSQRAANLSVETSKQALDKVLANPTSSQLQREQAQLTYDQAVQHVTDLGVQQDRLRATKAAADKAGVEGSQTVIKAQDGVATANRGVEKAQDNVGKTGAAVVEAQRAGAESVSKAQQTLTDAVRAQGQQTQQSAQSIAKAQEGISNAIRAQDQQAQTSAASIASAQRALATAQQAQVKATEQVSSSAQAANTALAALTPAGREFVTFITGTMEPVLKRLQTTAASGLLPGLQSGLANLLPIMPTVNVAVGQLAKAMGDLFSAAGKALDSPFYKQFITFIGDEGSKTLTTFGQVIGNLATGFFGLLQAFGPFTDSIGSGLLGLSQKFADFGRNTGASSGFQSFMAYVKEVSPLVVQTFADLGRLVGNLLIAFAPYGVVVLKVIDVTAQLLNKLGPDGLVGALAGAGVAFAAYKVAAASAATGSLTLAGSFGPIGLALAGLTAAFAKLYSDKGATGGDSDFKKFIDDRTQAFGKDLPVVVGMTTQGFQQLGGLLSGSFLNGSDRATLGITRFKESTKAAGDASSAWDGEQRTLRDTQDRLTAANGKLNDEIQKSVSKFTILRTGTLDAMTAADSLAASYDALQKSFAENGATLDGNTASGRANRKAVDDVARALNDKATADFKATEKTDGLTVATDQATNTVEANRQKLIQNLVQTGLSQQAAEDYTAKLLLTPAEIRTQINTPGLADATRGLQGVKQGVDNITDKSVTVTVTGKFDPQLGGIQDAIGNIHVPGGGVLLKALGGAISGPGGPRGDKIPALLSDNEHILPSDEVDMLGGQRGVYALRQVIRAGDLPGFAYGGAVNDGGLNRDPQLNAGGVDRTVTVTGVSNFDNFNTGLQVGLESFAQAVGAVVNDAYNQVKLKAQPASGGAPGGNYSGPIPGGDAVGRWRPLVDSTLGELNLNVGLDDKVLRQIATESGGDPNATQGNIGDVNNASGDLARGLMQVIGGTFRAFAGPYLSLGQYDPHASIYAGLNYARTTYGPDLSFLGQGHGYDDGGWVKPDDVGMNFTRRPEAVLTPDESAGLKAGLNGGGAQFGGKDVTVNVYFPAGAVRGANRTGGQTPTPLRDEVIRWR